MPRLLHHVLVGLSASIAIVTPLCGQQPAAAPAQAPPQVQLPPQFQLNHLEQAFLDQLLDSWERESGKVSIFQCAFERWEYNAAFGPGADKPLAKEKGELSYQKPDKGSFQITEIRKWQAKPIPPGEAPPAQAAGDWVVQPDAIGEHWVCDGKSVYEYRAQQKQLVVRPIPKELQGKSIVDGPLPFLFGAEAAKLKQRYWMRVEGQHPNNEEILLQALPKVQAQAAEFRAVEMILDRQRLLPKAMQVHLPNGDRHVYMFDLAGASVNSPLAKIQSLFESPRKPWGWQRVDEPLPPQQPPPAAPEGRQAAQPAEAPR